MVYTYLTFSHGDMSPSFSNEEEQHLKKQIKHRHMMVDAQTKGKDSENVAYNNLTFSHGDVSPPFTNEEEQHPLKNII